MPVFRYSCPGCDDEVETIVDRPSDPLQCGGCGSWMVRRFSPPVMPAIVVAGTETMTPGELALAHENKTSIEAQADRIRSGEVRVSTKSTVPLELRPSLPKTIY